MEPDRRVLGDSIVRLYAGAAVGLAVLLLVGLWAASATAQPKAVLPWSVATVEGLALLAGISIAFLCLGRYQAAREPPALWVGTAFLANGALTLLYILSWPGLVSYGGFLTDNPNTAHWLYLLKWAVLAAGLLSAVLLGQRPTHHRGAWAVAAGGAAVLAGVLVVLAEEYLPLVEERGRWTGLGEAWSWALALTFLVGSVLALRRYRRSGDYLLGYAAVMQLVAVFIMAEALVGAQRYDSWWYVSRTLVIVAYLILLVGLLSEYVGLYRRERDRAQEARRALAESEALRAIAQEIAGAGDVKRVMELVVEQAHALLGADQATLLVLEDGAGFAWHVDATAQRAAKPVATAPAEIERLLAETPRLTTVDGVDQALPEPLRAVVGAGARVALAVPVVAGATPYGVLALGYGAPHRLSARERGFAEALAGQAALSLEQARARREAAQAEAAREADRLKGELLATVSHELRTPLGAIKGHATTLARFGTRMPPAQQHEFLETIDRATDRLSELIDNLLLLQRVDDMGSLPIHLEAVDLAALVAEAVTEIAPRAAPHELVVTVARDLPPVHGDRLRLGQVVLNLLDNALKYAPDGGAVRLDAGRAGDTVLVSVRDEGLGIPPDQLGLIFERFHRVESDRRRTIRGTGLGLAICHAIVQTHGGRIWAESAGEGRGSTFYFTLRPWAPTAGDGSGTPSHAG
ncbi:MAG TPA: ATP-binding protein [Chloroflexota bacterium]